MACRQVRPKGDLLRVVRTPTGEVEIDEVGKAAGRGAYVCRAADCARKAATRQKLSRALGVPVGAETLARLEATVPRERSDTDEGGADD